MRYSDHKIGDIVVISEGYNNNYGKKGMLVEITDIDLNSNVMYKVKDVYNLYKWGFSYSWCIDVEKPKNINSYFNNLNSYEIY